MSKKKSLICLLADHNDGVDLDNLSTCVVPLDNFDFHVNSILYAKLSLVLPNCKISLNLLALVSELSSLALHSAAIQRLDAESKGKTPSEEPDEKYYT